MTNRTNGGVTVTVDRTAEIAKATKGLAEQGVYVGIPEAKTYRPGDPIGNALIGYINEHGAPEMNIPARPHLVPGVRAAQEKVVALFKAAGTAALDGRLEAALKALAAAGQTAADSVRNTIVSGGLAPPLAPGTLAARRRRGRSSIKPLFDVGTYARAITYVIRRGK